MSITAERLREVLHYDPDTGIFTWIKNTGYKRMAGKVAGKVSSHGYISIGIDRLNLYAHRLAFLYMTGKIPKEIDHIDTIRHNNKWANLREATRTFNNANRTASKIRKLPKGVTQVQSKGKKLNRYFARIHLNDKCYYLGCFSSPEEAAMMYQSAASGFFGPFMRAK